MSEEGRATPAPDGYAAGQLTAAKAIRAYRQARGLSARALSLAAGLSPSYVGKLESGAIEPKLRAVAKVTTCLGMKPREVHILMALEARGSDDGRS